jgi:hypothetical protein
MPELKHSQTRQIVVGQWKIDDTTYESLQTWQRYAERMSNASMVIEANIEVITSLRTFYVELATNEKFDMGVQYVEAIDAFVRQTNDMIHSFQWQKRRAKFLFDTMENRKILVSKIRPYLRLSLIPCSCFRKYKVVQPREWRI